MLGCIDGLVQRFMPESKICVFPPLLKLAAIDGYFQWKESVLSLKIDNSLPYLPLNPGPTLRSHRSSVSLHRAILMGGMQG